MGIYGFSELKMSPDTISIIPTNKSFERTTLTSIAVGAHEAISTSSISKMEQFLSSTQENDYLNLTVQIFPHTSRRDLWDKPHCHTCLLSCHSYTLCLCWEHVGNRRVAMGYLHHKSIINVLHTIALFVSIYLWQSTPGMSLQPPSSSSSLRCSLLMFRGAKTRGTDTSFDWVPVPLVRTRVCLLWPLLRDLSLYLR